MVIVHGACPTGADAIAAKWAYDNDVKTEPHPADWERLGRRAGYSRNRTMVRLGADLCLAFLRPCTKDDCRFLSLHGSHGTMHTIGFAQQAGVPVTIYREGW